MGILDNFGVPIESPLARAQVCAALALALASSMTAGASNAGTAFLLGVPTALCLFYGAAGFADASPNELEASGWLFPPSVARPITELWQWGSWSRVVWAQAVPSLVPFAAYSLVSLVALVVQAQPP